jgi:predicted secreted protein
LVMTAAALTVTASGIAQPASAPEPSTSASTVRDAFWV